MSRHFAIAMMLLAFPQVAWAGMPSAGGMLREVARLRIENMSFFLMGFLLCALGVQKLWNFLQVDWPALPKLTYAKALALLTLWGLLFILVLTMISGARELMTPGAWKTDGVTYQLEKRDPVTASEP